MTDNEDHDFVEMMFLEMRWWTIVAALGFWAGVFWWLS
jgi:hypothetical protein